MTRRGIAMAGATFLAACGDPSGLDSIEDAALRDMALVAADATVEVVGTMGRPFGFRSVTGGSPSLAGEDHAGRPGGHHGLGAIGSGTTVEVFYDAHGNLQDAYDDATTARIDVEAIVEGDVARADWTATIRRERNVTVTGLAGDEAVRTFSGMGSSATTRSRHTDDGDRTYEMTGSFTYSNIVVPVPGDDPVYPVSGVLTHSMNGTRTDADGSETRSVDLTITFDGDATATALVNGEEFEIDLSVRDGHRPWRGGRFGG